MSLTNLNSLPVELLGCIVSYLPEYKKLPLFRVNQNLYKIFNSNKLTIFPNYESFKTHRNKFSYYQDDKALQIYKFKVEYIHEMPFYIDFFISRVGVALSQGNVHATFKAEGLSESKTNFISTLASLINVSVTPEPSLWELNAKVNTLSLENLTIISITGECGPNSNSSFELEGNPLVNRINIANAKLIYTISGKGNLNITRFADKLEKFCVNADKDIKE